MAPQLISDPIWAHMAQNTLFDPFCHMGQMAKWAKYWPKYRGYWDTIWPLLAQMAHLAKWPKKGQKGSFKPAVNGKGPNIDLLGPPF